MCQNLLGGMVLKIRIFHPGLLSQIKPGVAEIHPNPCKSVFEAIIKA